MRYIRTKETDYGCVIDTIKYKEITGEDCYIPKNEIVAEADTIEELCDMFVMFCPNAPRKKVRVLESIDYARLYVKRDKRWQGNFVDKIYGSIWTNKGLIYVAKMNERGELELL